MDGRLIELMQVVDEAAAELATSPKVSDQVWRAVSRVREVRQSLDRRDLESADPYLILALDSGLFRSWAAQVEPGGEDARRRRLRPALEQVRQALRDLQTETPVADDRPVKDVVSWLDDVLDASQREIAELLETSPRTYQRWLSDSDDAAPSGEDARRVRVLARIVQHLRHVWTGPGVLMWLRAPHPALDNESPLSALASPDRTIELLGAASASRSFRAA